MEKRPSLKQPMTISELRAFAEGLAKRANRVTSGRKQDSISRGWLAIEKLYCNAAATLPSRVMDEYRSPRERGRCPRSTLVPQAPGPFQFESDQ